MLALHARRSVENAVRAVVDTNVWVSAAIKPRGLPGQILSAYRADQFTLLVSEPLLDELAEVLGRPKFVRRGISSQDVEELLALLRSGAEHVSVGGTIRVCRDPEDDVVIETAIGGRADVLISGDHDLTQMAEVAECLARAGIRVVTVRPFLQELNQP
jgi:putative PIN family toxin of toxin-antitoxin system